MISRKSAKLIADAYGLHFRTDNTKLLSDSDAVVWTLHQEEIINFLFVHEYEQWFLAVMKKVIRQDDETKLKKTVMEVHTGETMAPATPSWSWEQRQELGQQLLKKLAEDILSLYDSIPIPELDLSTAKNQKEAGRIYRRARAGCRAAETLDELKAQLELDGFVYRDGILYPNESPFIDESEGTVS